MRIGAAVVLVILIALAATVPYRSKIARLQEEDARLKQNNAELERQAASVKNLQDQVAELTRERDALLQSELAESAGAVSLSEPGGVIEIDKDGVVHGLQSLNAADAEDVKSALQAGRLKMPTELSALRDKGGRLMGSGGAPYGLVAPVATVVAGQRPSFRWRAVARAVSYVVSVYTNDSELVSRSESLSVTEWSPANNLERGRTYTWQVRALVDSSEVILPPPEAPTARFKILGGAKLSEFDLARKQYSGSHLLQGVVYARLGLLDDAERQLQALSSSNPKSAVARKLLASIRAMRASK
jgi:hypothetical protein